MCIYIYIYVYMCILTVAVLIGSTVWYIIGLRRLWRAVVCEFRGQSYWALSGGLWGPLGGCLGAWWSLFWASWGICFVFFFSRGGTHHAESEAAGTHSTTRAKVEVWKRVGRRQREWKWSKWVGFGIWSGTVRVVRYGLASCPP